VDSAVQHVTNELYDIGSAKVPTAETKIDDVSQSIGFFANKQPAESACLPKARHAISVEKRPAKHTLSCPPGRAHSTSAGPWSLEWVNRRKIFINDEDGPQKCNGSKVNSPSMHKASNKKGSGYLRHCAHNLK
jgi:hypothetical protein